MTLDEGHDSGTRASALIWVQRILLLFFFAQLFRVYLIPLHSHTLATAWWSWIYAASPLVLAGVLEAFRKAGSAPRLRGESADAIRHGRPRLYGRAY
ncbi:MAG: hypothetical protein KY464_09390 [Gemmatimonadetes bacterium]|nr:hypothetical protein [Gemmatimonadota bacterium]